MSLFLIILIAVLALYVIGEVWPSYPATTKKPPTYSAPPDSKDWAVLSTMPDLRVSEFAPDLKSAYYAERVFLSEASERITKNINKERTDVLTRRDEVLRNIYKDYQDKVTEIKTRRWKEGNPVTKKNPIDPDEMPTNPSKYMNLYEIL